MTKDFPSAIGYPTEEVSGIGEPEGGQEAKMDNVGFRKRNKDARKEGRNMRLYSFS